MLENENISSHSQVFVHPFTNSDKQQFSRVAIEMAKSFRPSGQLLSIYMELMSGQTNHSSSILEIAGIFSKVGLDRLLS